MADIPPKPGDTPSVPFDLNAAIKAAGERGRRKPQTLERQDPVSAGLYGGKKS
jgi:hypothetical protein